MLGCKVDLAMLKVPLIFQNDAIITLVSTIFTACGKTMSINEARVKLEVMSFTLVVELISVLVRNLAHFLDYQVMLPFLV